MIPLSRILGEEEAVMSFEENIQSRLSQAPSVQSDPPETDLNYYAKPENYSGSNIHAIQRLFQLQKKQGQLSTTNEETSIATAPDSRTETPILPSLPNSEHYTHNVERSEETEKVRKSSNRSVRPTSTESRARRRSNDSRPKTADLNRVHVTEPSEIGTLLSRSRRNSRCHISVESLANDLETGRVRRISLREETVDPLTDQVRKLSRSDDDSRPDTAATDVSRGSLLSRFGRISQLSRAVSSAKASSSSSKEYREARALLAREKFRHAGKLVLMALKWISTLRNKGEDDSEDQMTTFTDLANKMRGNTGELQNSGLTFDPTEYKAKKEINISQEVQHILSLPTHARSPEQLQTALFGLQHLRSFAEYPLHMQEKLCKVAWFEKVPANRIIIRQGHTAENFYFILSGHAVVKILEKNPKTGETQLRTATIMRKGMSFGELALLHHSKRTATVASQDTVQLLTIGRDDFFDIFMSGQLPGEIPDHMKYISTLDFMNGWPIQNLVQHPEMCLFHFFKRGVVIVKDSTKSDWLYIIKSGSCQVMKQLRGVTAKLNYKASALPGTNGIRLPKLGIGEVASKVDNGLKRQRTHRRRCSSARENEAVEEVQRINNPYKNQEAEDAMNRLAGTYPKAHHPHGKTGPGFSKSKYRILPGTNKAHFHSPEVKRAWGRPESPQKKSEEDQENNKGPVFVQVELLKPRDVFGLTTIHFNDDIERTGTQVSLVSRGAECIMLSKKFFAQHANETVKRMIRYQVRPYPTDGTLQENLQIKADWQLYKESLIHSLVTSNV